MPAFIPAKIAASILAYVGPWLLKAAPWAATLKARLPSLGASAAGVALAVGLAAVAGGVWLIHDWLGDRAAARTKATEIATDAERICTSANQAARIAALEKALGERERAEKMQAERATAALATLKLLTESQEAARNASPNPDQILIPAGDPWLLRGPFGLPGGGPRGLRAGAGQGRVEGPAGR